MKPIPAAAAPPNRFGQPTGGRSPPILGRVANQDAARIPRGLPTTYATMIPSVIGEVGARLRMSPLMCVPALASAKSGTIM